MIHASVLVHTHAFTFQNLWCLNCDVHVHRAGVTKWPPGSFCCQSSHNLSDFNRALKVCSGASAAAPVCCEVGPPCSSSHLLDMYPAQMYPSFHREAITSVSLQFSVRLPELCIEKRLTPTSHLPPLQGRGQYFSLLVLLSIEFLTAQLDCVIYVRLATSQPWWTACLASVPPSLWQSRLPGTDFALNSFFQSDINWK